MLFPALLSLVIGFTSAESVQTTDGFAPPAPAAPRPSQLIYSLEDTWRKPHQEAKINMLKRHKPRTILIHHTGTPQTKGSIESKLQKLYDYSIRAVGRKKAWGDVPYHFYIDRNGNMMAGRSVEFEPDTNTEFDPTGYLNITIEGDYTKKGGDTFTATQKATLKRLVADLKKQHKIKSVMNHNDVAQTDCPGNIHF